METAWTSTPSYGLRPFVRNLLIKLDKICQPTRSIATQLHILEQKYGMSFEQFDVRFQVEELPNQYSYEVEQDYLEWEGLLCRQRRLREVRDCLG